MGTYLRQKRGQLLRNLVSAGDCRVVLRRPSESGRPQSRRRRIRGSTPGRWSRPTPRDATNYYASARSVQIAPSLPSAKGYNWIELQGDDLDLVALSGTKKPNPDFGRLTTAASAWTTLAKKISESIGEITNAADKPSDDLRNAPDVRALRAELHEPLCEAAAALQARANDLAASINDYSATMSKYIAGIEHETRVAEGKLAALGVAVVGGVIGSGVVGGGPVAAGTLVRAQRVISEGARNVTRLCRTAETAITAAAQADAPKARHWASMRSCAVRFNTQLPVSNSTRTDESRSQTDSPL